MQQLNAIVDDRIDVEPDLMIVRVVPDGWDLPDFRPGQFAVLGLPASAARCEGAAEEDPPPPAHRLIRRSYSIASSSRVREFLEFYVAMVPGGSLSPRLFALEPGDLLWLGPRLTGTFTMDLAPPEKHVVMVATGTGLAPYMSMLRTAMPVNGGRRVAVLLGARSPCGLGYHAELESMQREFPSLLYLPTISRPADSPGRWKGNTGHVQDLWRAGLIEAEWGCRPTPADTRIFLCGNPAMIDDMSTIVTGEGFSEHSRKSPGEVFVEKYW